MLPSFSTIDGVQRLDFTSGPTPPFVPVPNLNQAIITTAAGVDHVQDIGPYYFNYYTLAWDLLKNNEFFDLLNWYIVVCGGGRLQFYYTTPYGDNVIVRFHNFGNFKEVSSSCLSGEVILKEIKQR